MPLLYDRMHLNLLYWPMSMLSTLWVAYDFGVIDACASYVIDKYMCSAISFTCCMLLACLCACRLSGN